MGGDTTIEQPQTPQAPTTASNMADYVNNYPQLMRLMQQYNPQQAELAYDISAEYGPQYGQLIQDVNADLYPETSELQENLATIANDRIAGRVPESMQQRYLDQLRAEVGPNAGSGIAGDYISRGMINQAEQYQNYYQNLGLSLAGRQPLGGYQTPAYQNAGAGYNYGQVANNNMQGYGSMANLYGNMYGTNAGMAQFNTQMPYMAAGTLLGGAGAFAGGLRA